MAVQAQKAIELADKIRIEILSERIPPGEKITEQAMAEQFGVSRTPVREAFRLLEAEGLIKLIMNRGAHVIGITKSDMIDLFRVRLLIETQAVEWAIQRVTDEELEALEESIDFMTFYTEQGDVKRMRDINAEFHRKMIAASRNIFLMESLEHIHKYIRFSAHVLSHEEDYLEEMLSEHTKIFRAFKKNNPSAGVRLTRIHVENALERSGLLE
jgi:DNA-binding GntR family transcriptional regulator